MDTLRRLRELLDSKGWSEYRLAKNCNLSESTIANIFRRNTIPSIVTLEAICTGCGITLAQFFADDALVELTPELRALFNEWAKLSEAQRTALLSLLQAINHVDPS